MTDTGKMVLDALDEVGMQKTTDKVKMLEGLDSIIETFTRMKEEVAKDEAGPLGMKMEQFRDIRPHHSFCDIGAAKGVDQFGPVITKIMVLDWKNAGRTFD